MDKILVIDFGGQYIQLIARAVREQNVYCEIMPWRAGMDKIRAYGAKGIILSGGPHSVYEENAPQISDEIFSLGVPVLGICYGMQYIAHRLGGVVRTAPVSEYGKQYLNVNQSELFSSVKQNSVVWMSHCDYISEIPAGFRRTATTPTCPVAALECVEKKIYGVQFHPEVNHTEYGRQILKNFLYSVCKIEERWSIGNFVTESVEKIRKKVGDGKVLCALSGGVDSAVAAALVQKAVGDRLTCVYVDHGLMRKNETEEIIRVFRDERGFNLIAVDAGEHFLNKLSGVTDPERKRKIIGEEFIRVFEKEAKKQIAKNTEVFGDETILTSCAGCYKTLLQDYEGLDVIHISELLAILIDEGRLKFDKKDLNVTYHDSCHLGRHCKVFDEPRKVIKSAANLIEMKNIKEDSLCCGAGGGVKSAYPQIASELADAKISQAKDTKCKALITACPFCKLNLKGHDLEVLDLTEFLIKYGGE